MKNLQLRQILTQRNVKQWQLAKKIGINEFTLSRHLREELDEETRREYLQYIDEIIKEREING